LVKKKRKVVQGLDLEFAAAHPEEVVGERDILRVRYRPPPLPRVLPHHLRHLI